MEIVKTYKMNAFKYILRSLTFYKKQHLAILLGAVLSTAILTGALIVGDSVKYSLNQLVNKRLGKVTFAMQTHDRFITNELASKLAYELDTEVSGILTMNGIAINSGLDIRINKVHVLGVDSTFWNLASMEMPELGSTETFISENVAKQLHFTVGDELLLRVQNAEVIPINTAFAQENQPSVAFRVTIKAILNDDQFARFSLKSDQKAPYNIWVSKTALQSKMALNNQINTLLVTDVDQEFNENTLQQAFEKIWTLEDAGLSLDSLADSSQWEVSSNRIFIDHSIADALLRSANAEGVLSYLVNAINFQSKATPYSFVSGVSKHVYQTILADNEIIINDWCAQDLGVTLGDSINIEYYVVGAYRKLEVRSKSFLVKSIQANQGNLFTKALTPNFPGLSDAESCSDWDTGVPIDLDKIRDKDEDYWNRFKGTPKAIINIETATTMWGNKFGNFTALRLENTEESIQNLELTVIKKLNARDLGFQFTNVKNTGKSAASKGVDFGELFLSLSFFVIAAGILLLVLMYSLHIISRKTEIAILSSLGFTRKKIVRLFFNESVFTIFLGGVLGGLLGIVYNVLVLSGLNTIWYDAVRTHALEIHINPLTLITGVVLGIFVALISIYIIIKRQFDIQTSQALKLNVGGTLHVSRTKFVAYAAFVCGLGLVAFAMLSNKTINTALFLGAGALILLSLVSFANLFMMRQTLHFETAPFGIAKLALKNLSLKRTRSLMAILLLSLGTFSVIITGANRLTFYGIDEQRQSGTGGFLFWVENSVPINHDLNSPRGKIQFNFADELLADSLNFIQFLTLDGDDASCLNLNQVQQPRILGIDSHEFERLNPCSFAKLADGVNPESPWSELQKSYSENVIPAYADQTVITWGLMKKVGDTLLYIDQYGESLKLVIVGGLNNSIFQGAILIADSHFKEHFPSVSGSKVMLIDSKAKDRESVATFLGFYFKDFGIEFTPTSQRLAEFNSVTNTYLNVFMILGGLGVTIGTLGFGIVLLRNKLERKKELALLMAVGITNQQLFKLVFFEHFIVLAIGLGIGILSALVGFLPSLISPSFTFPGMFVFVWVLIIFLSGLLSIAVAAKVSNSTQLPRLLSEVEA